MIDMINYLFNSSGFNSFQSCWNSYTGPAGGHSLSLLGTNMDTRPSARPGQDTSHDVNELTIFNIQCWRIGIMYYTMCYDPFLKDIPAYMRRCPKIRCRAWINICYRLRKYTLVHLYGRVSIVK